MNKRWIIEVVEYETDKVVHTVECRGGEHSAERVDDGMQHNLNHEKYYTRIVAREKGGG